MNIDKGTILKEISWWAKTLVVICLLAFVFTQKIVVLATVPTGSMENTINKKNKVLANRLAYGDEDPKRGDIVIFYAPDKVDELYIKRVIGLPGDKVVIRDSKIYINDSTTPLEEEYLKEEWFRNNGPYEYFVPENCYFMLGDNRNGSSDAREWSNTFVNRNMIIAKAECIYFPIKDIKLLSE